MTTAVHVRTAGPGDVPSVLCLLRDDSLDDQRPDVGEMAARVRRLIHDPRGRLLIATASARVVGALALSARSTLTGAANEAWLELLATTGDDRDCIGEMLVKAAERAAVELGCTRLTTECTVARTVKHRFFEAHGWSDAHPVSRRLARPAQPAPGVVNRFVAAAAAAAAQVGDVASAACSRGGPEQLYRAVGQQAAAVLRPLGLPIHLPASALHGQRWDPDGWWIVLDPLDGSCNAARRRGPYAFVGALIQKELPVAGVVVELTSGRRWIGLTGAGATVDGRPYRAAAATAAEPSAGTTAPPRRLGASGAISVELCELADGAPTNGVDVMLPDVALHHLAAPLVVLGEAGILVKDAAESLPLISPDRTWLTDLQLTAASHQSVG